jgi:hypothetical protein
LEILDLLDEICISNYPKNETGIVHSKDLTRIDKLFDALRIKQTSLIVCFGGTTAREIFYNSNRKKDEGIWNLDNWSTK